MHEFAGGMLRIAARQASLAGGFLSTHRLCCFCMSAGRRLAAPPGVHAAGVPAARGDAADPALGSPPCLALDHLRAAENDAQIASDISGHVLLCELDKASAPAAG